MTKSIIIAIALVAIAVGAFFIRANRHAAPLVNTAILQAIDAGGGPIQPELWR